MIRHRNRPRNRKFPVGRQLTRITRAWKTACRKIGLEGRLFHDFRRSAVRNLSRAGILQQVSKAITGHKTDSIFSRYNIVSQRDLELARGMAEEYNGKRRAQLEKGHNLGHNGALGKNATSQVIEKTKAPVAQSDRAAVS